MLGKGASVETRTISKRNASECSYKQHALDQIRNEDTTAEKEAPREREKKKTDSEDNSEQSEDSEREPNMAREAGSEGGNSDRMKGSIRAQGWQRKGECQ